MYAYAVKALIKVASTAVIAEYIVVSAIAFNINVFFIAVIYSRRVGLKIPSIFSSELSNSRSASFSRLESIIQIIGESI
jgi:hypothetical protein